MRTLPTLVSMLLIAIYASASLAGPVEVPVEFLPDNRVCVSDPNQFAVAAGDRLVLFAGTEPLARAAYVGTADGRPTFVIDADLASRGIPPKAYVIGHDLAASTIDHWPEQATVRALVDSVGPGGQSAWLAAGADDGVTAGESWCLRVGGQPAARCDVIYAAPQVCFCYVVPLASTPAVVPGARMDLWPTPAERRDKRASSGVAYVEVRGETTSVWIAAPPGVMCPPDPHVDFFRGEHYVGHGLVERRDDRFWYVRFTTPASSSTATGETQTPRVGDEAVIRTQADIDQRRFVVRVFELTPAGVLLNAGEADALAVGDTLTVYRDAGTAGQAALREVRRTYAVAAPVDHEGQGLVLRVGDELGLHPPAPPPRVIGSIQRVVDETLFSARLTARTVPQGIPLAVQHEGRTVGVAMLVAVDETGGAGGFVFPCSLTRPLSADMQLSWEAEAASRPTTSQAAHTDTTTSSRSSPAD